MHSGSCSYVQALQQVQARVLDVLGAVDILQAMLQVILQGAGPVW
jgi:hypothetical protein